MKRSRKFSSTLLVGFALTMTGGYLQGSCGACLWCDAYSILAIYSSPDPLEAPKLLGYTLKGTNNSWTPFAFNGSPNNNYTLYDVTCPYESPMVQTPSDPAVLVSVWTFDTLAFSCDVPSATYPYIRPASSGTNQMTFGLAIQLQVCAAEGGS